MNKEYSNSGYRIDWDTFEGNAVSLVGVQDDTYKEYTIAEAELAEQVYYHLCDLIDMRPEDAAKFKIRKDFPMKLEKNDVYIICE